MGRYPGPVGLPGIRWYDRAGSATSLLPRARSYVGSEFRKVDRDIDPLAPTLFELSDSNIGALSVIGRGLKPADREGHTIGFGLRAARVHFSGNVRGWLAIDREIGARVAQRIRAEHPQVAFCALTGIDKTSHSQGHNAQIVRDALRTVDETAARIRSDAEADGRWDSMHLWIVSDHGHSPVRAHEDLAGLIASWKLGVIAHPWMIAPGRDVAVMVSGNAMAHLYLDLRSRASLREPWSALEKKWAWLPERLLERESVDLLFIPLGGNSCEVRAKDRGAARIEMKTGAIRTVRSPVIRWRSAPMNRFHRTKRTTRLPPQTIPTRSCRSPISPAARAAVRSCSRHHASGITARSTSRFRMCRHTARCTKSTCMCRSCSTAKCAALRVEPST